MLNRRIRFSTSATSLAKRLNAYAYVGTMNASSANASAAAVASIVSGAVINALGLHSSSNSSDGCGSGPVTPAREEINARARGQPNTARGATGNRNSRLEA